MHTKKFLLPAMLVTFAFTACKKEASLTPVNLAPTTDSSSTSSLSDRIKDTTLLDSKDIYLWYDKIPSTFNARSYADPSAIMTAIRQYSIEPGFTAPVDRWSFAMKQQEWDDVSSGVSADFGLSVFFLQEGDLRVKSVEKASPAGRAGVKRGWRITKINGSTNITTANAGYIVQNVFQSNATTFTFLKPDGTTVDASLNAASYQENPVMLDSVYTVGAKKIGYFVFSSFLGDTNAVYNNFSRIANRFASEGVQDLVVDLRYNGGGYVSVAEKLADYLAPNSANGGVMITQKFNKNYSAYNSTDLFRKEGPLNLSRIFFIVSSSTASASELLINSLKPYMDVVLLGASKTHGKPVGFFPIPVGNWYIFPVSFSTVNKNGEGAYYGGLSLNNQVADGLDKDWGDLTETSLASAVKYIASGSFRVADAGKTLALPTADVIAGNKTLDASTFKGAVEKSPR